MEIPKYGIITREKKCAMSAKDDESPFFCFFGHTAQAVPLVCRIVNVAWRGAFLFFSHRSEII